MRTVKKKEKTPEAEPPIFYVNAVAGKNSTLHMYRKKKTVMRTLCDIDVFWKSTREDDGVSFAPAFPPNTQDAVCKECLKANVKT